MIIKVSIGIIVAAIIVALGMILFAGGETQTATKKAAPVASTWNGSETATMNATFNRKCSVQSDQSCIQRIIVKTIDFQNLNKNAANIQMHLVINSPSGRPAWLQPKSFKGITGKDKIYRPAAKITSTAGAAGNYNALIQFKNIPISLLGPTAALPSGGTGANTLSLKIYPADGAFMVQIVAPEPPMGYELAENGGGISDVPVSANKLDKQQDKKANKLATQSSGQ
jgi:hypothetical protein